MSVRLSVCLSVCSSVFPAACLFDDFLSFQLTLSTVGVSIRLYAISSVVYWLFSVSFIGQLVYLIVL